MEIMMIFLRIKVKNMNVAYTIFETLNNRGNGLTESDLIKNLLFSRAEDEGTLHEVQENWSFVQEEITQYPDETITSFLKAFYNSYKKINTEKNLYENVTDFIAEESAKLFSGKIKKNAKNNPVLKLRNHLVQVFQCGEKYFLFLNCVQEATQKISKNIVFHRIH